MIDSSMDFDCINYQSFSLAVSHHLDGGSGDRALRSAGLLRPPGSRSSVGRH